MSRLGSVPLVLAFAITLLAGGSAAQAQAQAQAQADGQYPRSDTLAGRYLIEAVECLQGQKQVAWVELEPSGKLPNQVRFVLDEVIFAFKGESFSWEWRAIFAARMERPQHPGERSGSLSLGRAQVTQSDLINRRIPIRWTQDPTERPVRGLPVVVESLPVDATQKKGPLSGLETPYRVTAGGDLRVEVPQKFAAAPSARCELVLKPIRQER